MEEVFRFTGHKVGVYTLKIVGIVGGIGLSIIILRPVRRAVYARLHARSRNIYREKMEERKVNLFSNLQHLEQPLKIVELGTGVCENAVHYPAGSELTCISTSVYRKKDIQRIQKSMPEVHIIQTDPEDLSPLADSSVDVVICMLTLCTVPDVQKSLSEIKRILKNVSTCFIFCDIQILQSL